MGTFRGRPALAVVVTLVAALLITLPGTARAATHSARMSMYVANGHVNFHFFADPGGADSLTVDSYSSGNAYCGGGDGHPKGQACYFVADPGAAGHLEVGGSCQSLEAAYPGQAECYLGDLGRKNDSTVHTYIKLNDGRDTVSLNTGAASAVIDAGSGNDNISTLGAARIKIIGGAGNDVITGHSASDILDGGDGQDTIVEPCGSRARIDGGPGTDTVSFACFPSGQKIDLRNSPRLANLESVIGTPSRDVIYGANRAGTLRGEGGNDTIYGGAVGQTLSGGPGKDTIYGGPGNDRMTDSDGPGKYVGRGGKDTIIAAGSLYGGPGNDRLICTGWTSVAGNIATSYSCLLSDGSGNDYVRGVDTAGQSWPYATDGDLVIAGTGSDTYDLRGGPLAGTATYCGIVFNSCADHFRLRPDRITYAHRTKPVHVSFDGKKNDGEAGEHDDIVSAGEIIGGSGDDVLIGANGRAITLFGGKGNDTLRAGKRNDLLYGERGNDHLQAGAGNDQMTGGPGVDTFNCGAGKDRVGDRKRGERATGCEVFAPLPTYKVL